MIISLKSVTSALNIPGQKQAKYTPLSLGMYLPVQGIFKSTKSEITPFEGDKILPGTTLIYTFPKMSTHKFTIMLSPSAALAAAADVSMPSIIPEKTVGFDLIVRAKFQQMTDISTLREGVVLAVGMD